MLLPGNFIKQEYEAEATTPRPNCGIMIDSHNGNYVKGVEDGEEGHWILNGGVTSTTGILGGPNQFKSTLADWLTFSTLERYYDNASALIFDAEDSKEYEQLLPRMPYFPRIQAEGLYENKRVFMIRQSKMFANKYWDEVRKPFGKEKYKESKGLIETPILNGGRGLISVQPPTFEQLDSFSRMNFEDVEAKFHDVKVDSKDRNMEFTRPGLIKTRILGEMPTINPQHGFYSVMTAHLGEDMQLDAKYGAMPKKVLANLEAGKKVKGCPEQFLYMPNNMWFCANQRPHWDSNGIPIYGMNGEPGRKGSKDVVVISVMNLRGKSGSSGNIFPLLMSQTLGLLPNLSMFNYLRDDQKYYGMEAGNNTTMALDFCPDIRMTRNKVWETVDSDYRLQRALELTVGLAQIRNTMTHLGGVIFTPPAVIFEELKSKGYDWDVILGETRGYWQFTNVKSDKKYLSALDLLKMYEGNWMPGWLGKC